MSPLIGKRWSEHYTTMIRQEFHVEEYWKVVVWYSLDYHFFDIVLKDVRVMGIDEETVKDVYKTMKSGRAKAVTISNVSKHISLILFNSHSNKIDYVNSIVHEAEHVKQAMLEAYDVEDNGELPAYTIGYLVGRMCEVFCKYL